MTAPTPYEIHTAIPETLSRLVELADIMAAPLPELRADSVGASFRARAVASRRKAEASVEYRRLRGLPNRSRFMVCPDCGGDPSAFCCATVRA